MIKFFNIVEDIKSSFIFKFYKLLSKANKYKFRSNRGLGDLFIDILFINWLSKRIDKKIFLFCRTEHLPLVNEIVSESVIVKEVNFLNYFFSWDLWRNKNGVERRYRLNKSLSARYKGFFNSIINKWFLYDKELDSLSQIFASGNKQEKKKTITSVYKNRADILIINSYPLSSQCNKNISVILDNLICLLINAGYDVKYTREISSLNLKNSSNKISIQEIKNLDISSSTVLGIATGPFWFTYLNENIKQRIGITDVDILDFLREDNSLSSAGLEKWFSLNVLNIKNIKLDDILANLANYFKKV